MEFHTNENCSLADYVINNKTLNYDIISKENMDLRNILINSKETTSEMESIIANLRDLLITKRQTYLQMYIQGQTCLQHEFRASLNIAQPETHRSKNNKELVSSSVKNKTADCTLLSKYNDLMNLINEQKCRYEADLDLFLTLNSKRDTKLKLQLAEMNYCIVQKFEVYKGLQNDLLQTRKNSIKYCKELQAHIKAMNAAQAKQVNDIRQKMILEAKNTANANAREAVSVITIQLRDKDKLVAKLRQDQARIEANIKKQEQEFCKQLQNLKQVIDELQKQLRCSENKYRMLELHRIQECRRIAVDVPKIRKKVNEIKSKIDYKEHICKIFPKKLEHN